MSKYFCTISGSPGSHMSGMKWGARSQHNTCLFFFFFFLNSLACKIHSTLTKKTTLSCVHHALLFDLTRLNCAPASLMQHLQLSLLSVNTAKAVRFWKWLFCTNHRGTGWHLDFRPLLVSRLCTTKKRRAREHWEQRNKLCAHFVWEWTIATSPWVAWL